MDLSSVFAVLQQADKQAQETNPYLGFAGVGDQLGGLVVKSAGQAGSDGSPRYGIGELSVAGLLSGLLSGGAGQMARGYQNEQNQLALDSLSQIMRGGDVAKPEGMSPNVFNAIRGPATIFKNQQDIENRQIALKSALDLRNDVLKTVASEAVKNPYRPGSSDILKELGIGPSQPSTSPTTGGQAAPAGKTIEEYMKQYQGNQTLAEAAAKRDLEAPDRKEADLVALRTKFESDPEVQLFQSVDIGFKAMQKAYEDKSGTSDVELTRRGIQAIEPGLAVRTDDQTAIANSSSIPDSWKTFMQGALTGQSKLPPEVREGLMRIAERSYNEHAQVFNKKLAFNLGEFQRRGLPGQFSYMTEAVPSQRFSPQQIPGIADPGAADNKPSTGALGGFQSIQLAPGVRKITDANGNTGIYELVDGQYRLKK